MRIPLFVSASGILVLLALGFAWTFQALGATYERSYVRAWRSSWLALGAYGLFAGLALLAVNVPGLAPLRSAFSLGSMLAAFVHIRALLAGMEQLCTPERPASAWPLRAVALLIAAAGLLVLVPVERRSDAAMQLYLIRIGLLALAWGIAYTAAGLLMLRRPPGTSALGRLALLVTLFAYAALRVGEPATHFLGPSPVLAQFLTFGGLPLLVGVGAGMLITLLEVEQARAVEAADARSAAERTANESEATLAAALATSSDPVFIVNRDGTLASANRRFVELVSQATGMVLSPGMSLEALMDEPTRAFWTDALPRVLAGEAVVRLKRFRFASQAELRAFSVRFTPVREGGSVIGALVVAHDSTEEERLRHEMARREEWFRSLIENASDMIFQVTPDALIEYASPSVDRVLGYDHLRMIGQSGFEFIDPDDVPTVADALRRSLERDETVPTVVPLRARTAQGDFIPLEGVSRPYTERDGSERLIVALRDVRERQRLEDELTGARRLEAIGRLAGGVAHDFNNLLTAVAGNVTLLKLKTAEQAGIGEHLVEIEHSVQRGAELTRRLLAFARQQRIEPRILHIPTQLADLERLLRRLLGEGILVDLDVPRTLWSIRADATAFEQILVNLAVNSRDAMPQGGTFRVAGQNLTVGAGGRESLNLAPGDWVQLEVEDTGGGIPPELVGRIFEPFFTTKADRGGTGLGLATVYGAVTQMGGQVRVDSTPGRGTTFTMFFPRVIAPHETAAPVAKPALPQAAAGDVVLLMEDETPVREVTAKLLRRLGYEVLAAADGEEGVALAEARTGPISIVVSDIVMPGIHGDVACARIRERRPDVPVLFISGFSQEALRWQHGMPAGARLLSKPFTLDDLALSVRELIDGR
ncbi:PAS domain S-box protein [Pseudogemmatithrix spongiicola]|uniref:histidine kinase n=1 Tax=Pseudogemmatithrix spongiicola TaxID=3062599 RepID=A0AA49K0G3_9BACT|nr:PAS domain S-box protein [Gemmatimonadaceae bacterium 'strain 138']WKW15188.1 PAS domain S-box protein [Gemmatimonadaceae bacterium 'strain 318']